MRGTTSRGFSGTSYELLKEAGKEVEWVPYDHPLHGYIYPLRGEDGAYAVDETQAAAVGKVISFFDSHLKA